MRNNKVKFIILFILVICLSFIHVHCSINTQDNPCNPLTLILMLIATSYDGNTTYEIIAYYSVHFIVTVITSFIILKFRNMKIWLLSYMLIMMLCICCGTYYWDILNILEGLSISKLYEDFYGYGNAFSIAAVSMLLQILVLITYIGLHIFRGIINQKGETKR